MADTRESVLDRIRRRRQELSGERHIDIDLPGYGGDVVIRFGPVAWEAIDAIRERVQSGKGSRRLLDAQSDLVIGACIEINFRVGDELVPILEGEQVRFDQRLVDALGLDESATSARAVLLQAFGLANAPEIALVGVAVQLMEWMAETDVEIDQALLGE